MELNQYEGLSPFQHFYHDGSSGFASFLTYDGSLLPAAMTVSSVLVRLDDKLHAPHGMKKHIAYTNKYAPLMNSNADRFFRIDRTALDLSHRFVGVQGTDMLQSHATVSLMDNPQHFHAMPSYEAFVKSRLVFYAHQMHFVYANQSDLARAEFHSFQPFVHAFDDGTALYAYLPLGQHRRAFFVVTKDDRSKVLTMDTSPNDPVCHMNHWSFFVKEEVEDFYDEEKTITGASLVMTNLCKGDDGLSFFYADRKLSWPRTIFCCCAECFAETSMSQLCGGHFCYTADSFSHLAEETYNTAMDNVRRGYDRLKERAKDYHLVSKLTKVSSSIVLFDKMPPTLSSSTIRNAEDSFMVRVNGSVFDVKIDFGRVIDAFENTIPHAKDAIAFSPLFKRQGFFFYVKRDGLLVLQDDIFDEKERKVYGRIVPKEAENVKLFLPLGNTVYCYWTVGRKHYMTNLETFLAEGILGDSSKEEKAQ